MTLIKILSQVLSATLIHYAAYVQHNIIIIQILKYFPQVTESVAVWKSLYSQPQLCTEHRLSVCGLVRVLQVCLCGKCETLDYVISRNGTLLSDYVISCNGTLLSDYVISRNSTLLSDYVISRNSTLLSDYVISRNSTLLCFNSLLVCHWWC